MSYIFHLGREKELCLAELISIYPDTQDLGGGFALVESTDPEIITRLGGTIKISEVLNALPASLPTNFSDLIGDNITKFTPEKGKFNYGISIYPSQTGLLKRLLKAAKQSLKANGTSSRYINQDWKNLSSIQSANCTELNLVFTDEKTYLSKTVATQDIALYSKRDYDRPGRDDLSGMLPPKLAQMLINLASPTPETVIYDPFCGSGTVLQEAMLMGLNCKGSDISEKAIKDSKNNIKWLKREFSPEGNCLEIEVKDATKLTEKDFGETPLALVGESYLGPPQKGLPTEEEARKTLAGLEPIYLGFLGRPIPSGTTIVLAVPFFNKVEEAKAIHDPFTNKPFRKTKHNSRPKPVFLENFIEKTKKLGYSVQAPEDQLTYARRKQIVGRMILRLKKN